MINKNSKIERIVIFLFPILLGVCFVVIHKKIIFFLYELICLSQVFTHYDELVRKKIFIASCFFFNTCFLGIALTNMCEKRFDELFYYFAMFVVAEFISSIMILTTMALELFFEKIRVFFLK